MVRNELMGSTENGKSERRITAPWCGSRAAGWRVAAGKAAVLIGVISLIASEASLVSLVWIWNATVPRLEMTTILRKLDTNVAPVAVVSALATLLKLLTLKASNAPEEWRDFASADGFDGFDGVDGGFDGFDGFNGSESNDGDSLSGSEGFEGWGASLEME